MPNRPNEDRMLTCQLDEDEVDMRGRQLAVEVADWAREEEAKKEAAKLIGARIDKHKAAAQVLEREINSKTALKPVLCRWGVETGSDGQKKWVCHRSDTGEVVATDNWTAADEADHRQLTLGMQ